MKKLSLLSLLAISCASSNPSARGDASLPLILPGIPRSITKHCAETSKAIADVASELTDASPEARACTELKLFERCLARMEKVSERLNKKVAPDPFFDRFPGAFDDEAAGNSLSELTEHPACEGMAASLQAMQAAVAIGGRIGNEWEKFDARTPTVCN